MGSPCPGGVTYVALRLLSTRPSRTTPAPTLLAEPSRPSTVGMAAAPPLRGRFRLPGGGTSARWPIPELLPGRLPVTPSATSATPQRHFRCPPTARFSRPITGVATRQLPVILRAASALFQHNFWCTPPRELLGQSLRSIGATSGAPLRHFRSAFSSTSGARPQHSFVDPPFHGDNFRCAAQPLPLPLPITSGAVRIARPGLAKGPLLVRTAATSGQGLDARA